MRTGKLKVAHSKPLPIAPAKPVRAVLECVDLCAFGGSYKSGNKITVQARAVDAKLAAARAGGYRLWNPSLGIDSDVVTNAPVVAPMMEFPVVQRSGNPGRKVIETKSGTKYLSVKQAAIKCGVSEQSIRMSVKNSTPVRGLQFKHDEISN